MADYSWPEASKRTLIGKRVSRLDGPLKVTGVAKYSYDVNRSGMLFAKILHCPHAHARITGLDTSAAEAVPGVKTVRVVQGVGSEIKWEMDEVATVAAETEEAAEDGVRAIPSRLRGAFPLRHGRGSGPGSGPGGCQGGDRRRPGGGHGISGCPQQGFLRHCCHHSLLYGAPWSSLRVGRRRQAQCLVLHPGRIGSARAVCRQAGPAYRKRAGDHSIHGRWIREQVQRRSLGHRVCRAGPAGKCRRQTVPGAGTPSWPLPETVPRLTPRSRSAPNRTEPSWRGPRNRGGPAGSPVRAAVRPSPISSRFPTGSRHTIRSSSTKPRHEPGGRPTILRLAS